MLWVTWLWMLPFTSSSLENYFYYRTFNCSQRKKALFLHRIVFLQDYGNTWQGVTRNTLNREKYCKFDLPTHSKEHNKIISKLTVLTLFGNLELHTSSATLAEGTLLALEAKRSGPAQTQPLYTVSPQPIYGTDWAESTRLLLSLANTFMRLQRTSVHLVRKSSVHLKEVSF